MPSPTATPVRQEFPKVVQVRPTCVETRQQGRLGPYGYDYLKEYRADATRRTLTIDYALTNTGARGDRLRSVQPQLAEDRRTAHRHRVCP